MAAPSTRNVVPLLQGGAVTPSETSGTAASAFVGSGLDARTADDAGTILSIRVASGLDAYLPAETAAGVSVRTSSGADTALSAETAAGITQLFASGADEVLATEEFSKDGAGILEALAEGASVHFVPDPPIKAELSLVSLVN